MDEEPSHPGAGGAGARRRRGITSSSVFRVEGPTEGTVGKVWMEKCRGKSRFEVRDLLVDGRCSQAVLDFLSTTDLGGLVPPGEGVGSGVSEWELQELRERKGERRAEIEELGAAGELGAG